MRIHCDLSAAEAKMGYAPAPPLARSRFQQAVTQRGLYFYIWLLYYYLEKSCELTRDRQVQSDVGVPSCRILFCGTLS